MATTSCRRWRKTPWTKALAWRRSIRRPPHPAACSGPSRPAAHSPPLHVQPAVPLREAKALAEQQALRRQCVAGNLQQPVSVRSSMCLMHAVE